jgi:hypothetical protein
MILQLRAGTFFDVSTEDLLDIIFLRLEQIPPYFEPKLSQSGLLLARARRRYTVQQIPIASVNFADATY